MRKSVKFIVCFVLLIALTMPFGVLAKDGEQSKTVSAPTLQSIEFNDAEIDGEFAPTEFYYKINVKFLTHCFDLTNQICNIMIRCIGDH